MKAAPFTVETASAMGKLSAQARARRKLAASQAAGKAPLQDDSTAIQRTKNQLAKLDDLIDRALQNKDDAAFLALASVKDKLWKLVQPTAGVLRPMKGKSRQIQSQPIETPQENSQEIKFSVENLPVPDPFSEVPYC